jgi:photosystem II stability/assembly factor-like uncharacterized protein
VSNDNFLEGQSGEVTPEYRSRLKQALAEPRPTGTDWMAVVAVIVVTLLTATSVGVLVAARHARPSAPVASAPRVTSPSPSPEPTLSPLPKSNSVQLSAPSASAVWALVDYGALFLSTDQGDHWVKRTMPSNIGIRPSVTFINESEGWLLAPGSPNTQCEEQFADIWHTTDGARTWQDLGARIDKTQCKNGIWFVDSMHGFVTAWDQNHRPTVFRTSDGGDHWAFGTVPDNPIFVTGTGGFTLHVGWMKTFGGTVYLEASGTQHDPTWPRDFIYTSRDGGATWTWKQKVSTPVLALVTETRWLELDVPGQLYESDNGGQAMAPFASDIAKDTPVDGAVMVFADPSVGYVAAGGTLQRTLNGGAHWTPLSPPWSTPEAPAPSSTPSGIPLPTDVQLSAPSSGVVWALVAGGYLFRSTDQGATWQQRSWPPYAGGGGNPVISFVDDRDGWALFPGVRSTQCQQGGAQLWRTSDGAASWQLIASVQPPETAAHGLTVQQCKEYAMFSDRSHGFIAGHDTSSRPIISRTADWGVTWSQSTLPDPPGYVTNGGGNALQVVSIRSFPSGLLAVAESPMGAQFVFGSTDGGATWSFRAQLSVNPYVNVALVTAARWVVIGNDGKGQETTDAGNTWHAYSCDYQDAAGVASTFVFADPGVGYGTVRGGIQRTTDGGLHWTRLHTPGT